MDRACRFFRVNLDPVRTHEVLQPFGGWPDHKAGGPGLG